MELLRASYPFAGTFPFFAADRLRSRIRERRSGAIGSASDGVPQLPETNLAIEKVLMAATRLDRRLLPRWDLPFGSSVVVAARKPTDPARKEWKR